MKTILVPSEEHDAMAAVLEAAWLVAKTFDSYMEGFAVRPVDGTFMVVEPVTSIAVTDAHDREAALRMRETFETFMRGRGVPQTDREPAVLSYGWPMAEAVDDNFIGSYGRGFDLIVLGRPGRALENSRISPLEAALFERGKPVLIVPPAAPQTIGRNVLVAWNASAEEAHTNAFALPLLRNAEQVTVLTVEGGTAPGPSGEDAAHHLRRNGIKAAALAVKPEARSAGETILDQAAALGCDLLVKSAYTQSRLRQMIFGGVTRHILANAALPVFMAH